MTYTTEPPLADTSDMIGVHRVFREALAAAPRLIGEVGADESARTEVVGTYYDNVLRLLSVHHTGEDELLTPKLLERVPSEAETIGRVAAQHDTVHSALDATTACLRTWRSDPTVQNRSALLAALAMLDAPLTVHLDDEERLVLPIAAQCINAAEWGELPGHGMRHFDGDKLWLITGLIREQMTAAQRSEMDDHMPPPVRAMWTGTGQAAFAGFVAELRD